MAEDANRRNVTRWACFSVALIFSWLIGEVGWMLKWWLAAQIALATLSAILAVWALAGVDSKGGPVALVLVGLAFGNWRLIEVASMAGLWSIGGFAP